MQRRECRAIMHNYFEGCGDSDMFAVPLEVQILKFRHATFSECEHVARSRWIKLLFQLISIKNIVQT